MKILNADAADVVRVRWISFSQNREGEWEEKVGNHNIVVAAAGLTQVRIPLHTGYLVSVQVFPINVQHQIGSCYVYVELEDNEVSYRVLIQDYCTYDYSPGWPASSGKGFNRRGLSVKTIAPANPAAGANLSYAVPDYYNFELIGIALRLVTDANVAARRVRLDISDGTGSVAEVICAVTQAASLTKDYYFLARYPIRDNTLAGKVIEPLPKLWFYDANAIYVTVDNIQVGDQISNVRFNTQFNIVR